MATGRELGLRRPSVNAVTRRLGVVHRAVPVRAGRWELERLVESILAELRSRDDPTHDVARHLLSFAIQLRARVREHPASSPYPQTSVRTAARAW